MKQKTLFSIALAGLMLGACSKDAVDNGASWNENGEGYISLSLNMPTTSGSASRVVEFEDGVSSEYKVNDAILVLFTGTSETNATFNSAYTMGLGNWENDDADQVTTSARIVQKINEITNLGNGTKLYALVVLNANGVITVADQAGLSVNGTALIASSSKLSDLNTSVAAVTKDAPWNTSGFLMSNSPLFNAAGGSTQPTTGSSSSTLVEIEAENIYTTEAEAIANPAASIYVERAQAKVQVNDATENKTFTITEKDGTTETTYTYAIKNWDIDNYNTQSKLTRDFDDTWAAYPNAATTASYRFVDGTAVETGLYRTYWGKDVNYETNETNPALKTIDNEGETPTLSKKPGEYTYCLENTTSEVPATGTQLTRVIISATLAKGENGTAADFFTISGDRSKIYLKASGEGSLENEVKSRILNDEDVKAAATAANVTLEAASLTFAYSNEFTSKASGILDNSKDFTVTLVGTITDVDKKIQNAINAVLYTSGEGGANTNNFEIDYYKGGVCYYQAFIRHFGDDEAPWNKDSDPNQAVSDDTKKKYLGRYGVLRNSWYVLNVNSITQIGDSTYPEIPDEPIDKKEFYISVDIKIMPWAKRTQKVDL